MFQDLLGVICTNLAGQGLPDLELKTLRQINKESKIATDSAITALKVRDFYEPQVIQ